jgi:heat shock protein HslJ
MRRLLSLALALALVPALVSAQDQAPKITGIDWQLLAIDGQMTDAPATLRVEEDGTLAGAAPCNRWSAMNTATLPTLTLSPIRATRMACDRLADEQVFFDALAAMTAIAADGERNLVLTGPEGRSMEFVIERTVCKTCKADG